MGIEDSLGFILGRSRAKLKNDLGNALRPYSVTVEQWVILNRLWEQDGISQKDLSEKSRKDQPTITRILDKLEKRGLIHREIDPSDRRAFLIYLTTEGWEIRRSLTETAAITLKESLKNLTSEEQDHLKYLLKKIIEVGT